MRQLFPSFDGPVRTSAYYYAPRKRRWWPLAIAFGAGVGCVLLVSWEQAGGLIGEPKPIAIQWTSLPADATDAAPPAALPADTSQRANVDTPQQASVDTPQQANSGPSTTGSEVRAAETAPVPTETPLPIARPRTAAATAGAAPQNHARAKLTNSKAPESKTSTTKPNIRTANAAPSSAVDQSAGMVRIDEEELPDGRWVPVYRRPTIFDGVRSTGVQ